MYNAGSLFCAEEIREDESERIKAQLSNKVGINYKIKFMKKYIGLGYFLFLHRPTTSLKHPTSVVSSMTEYTLNKLSSPQLAELAYTSATFIAVVNQLSVKIELYYIDGHFIEISYNSKKGADSSRQWRLYSANHFPDVPANTHYLTIYSQQVTLLIGKDSSQFDTI